jgi:hypothetical protein
VSGYVVQCRGLQSDGNAPDGGVTQDLGGEQLRELGLLDGRSLALANVRRTDAHLAGNIGSRCAIGQLQQHAQRPWRQQWEHVPGNAERDPGNHGQIF